MCVYRPAYCRPPTPGHNAHEQYLAGVACFSLASPKQNRERESCSCRGMMAAGIGTEVFQLHVIFTAAPTGDEILPKGDLYKVVEALLEAKDKAYELGLRLKLSPDEVESICKTHQDPQERLTAIIRYLLKQVEPRPTWRLIVEALTSTLVNLPRLAEEVEAAHCPNGGPRGTPNGIAYLDCRHCAVRYIFLSIQPQPLPLFFLLYPPLPYKQQPKLLVSIN